MLKNAIIECVPNFSEGRDPDIIRQITAEVESVQGVSLLDVDPGQATNRTVVTFVGDPDSVIEAAYRAIAKAAQLIDMSKHKGEHPRMGATDVCPLIPISGITMEETVAYAHKLAERVGKELNIPVFMYEYAALKEDRKNLATIRSGEYEGMADKLKNPDWRPDYGPQELNIKAGASVIGARDFLIAYNVNLNTKSVKKANSVAFDVREAGRVLTKNGQPVLNKNGEPKRIPGSCKSVKGIGWYIDEYGIAQISMNLTNINDTTLHKAFEECVLSADSRGLRVTGSELVGMVPLNVLLDAGTYFLKKQKSSYGVSEKELINTAIQSLGLSQLAPFDPEQKIIEYKMRKLSDERLVRMSLVEFADETAADSPAPGGGSVSAYVGALGTALGTMVANLSASKKGWEKRWDYFSGYAALGQNLKNEFIKLVDKDTLSYEEVMQSFKLPKGTQQEIEFRKSAIRNATINAIIVPENVMKTAAAAIPIVAEMVREGNPNSLSDAAVGALCLRTAIEGAFLNVRINTASLPADPEAKSILVSARTLFETSIAQIDEIMAIVNKSI